jgi:hypothetical protein
MYVPQNPLSYPFPTIFPALPGCILALVACLPKQEDILECFTGFDDRVNVSSLPYVPFEVRRYEVERFLSDTERNANMRPDMLALLFAAMAFAGQQMLWDRCNGK